MSRIPSFARAWLAQRESGNQALAAIARNELRALDDTTALQQSDALLAATPRDAVADGRRATSGFVDQQRLFARARK
ncbi:MAG TPA: hypothetical protein VIV11_29240 [Kofleriaceae bacterium]